MNTFRRLKEKITGEDIERRKWRELAESEIDLMPEDMAKEYRKWLDSRDEEL